MCRNPEQRLAHARMKVTEASLQRHILGNDLIRFNAMTLAFLNSEKNGKPDGSILDL